MILMIIITGASDGLGYQLAKLYKDAGKIVVNVSRRECPVADYNFLHDLAVGKDVEAAAQEILALDEPLEILINNAGVYSEQPIRSITKDEVKRLMATNVESNILLTSFLIDRIKQDGTDILSVISTAGRKGNPSHAVYAASKWAQRGYTEALQAELKDTSSRVIAFYPGGMKTKLFEKELNYDPTDDGLYWMDPRDIAIFAKQILDLPKNIEVSDVVINRKKT